MGYPKIYIRKHRPTDFKKIAGIAKIKIFPPKQLYIPILPPKVNGKLMFALCRVEFNKK